MRVHRAPSAVDQPLRSARVATAAAFAGQGLMFTVLLTHLPQFTDRYRVSEGTVTAIVFMVTVLAGVGSLLSERAAARTSSRVALRGGLLVVSLAGALIGVASGFWLFVAGFALYGLGLGAVDASGNMQAVAVQHRYGRSIITSFHAAWSAAAITGALYVAAGERLGIGLPASILPVAGAVLLVAGVAGNRLLLAPGGGVADPGEPAAVVPARAAGVRVGRGPLLLLGLAMTCFWAVDSGVSNWSALYLRDLLAASGSTAALGYAGYQATALVSRLSGDLVVRRIGAVATVRLGAALGTAGAVLVVLAPAPGPAIAGFALTGLGLPVVAPLCFAAAAAAVRGADHAALARPDDVVGTPNEAAVESVVARLNVFNYLGSLLGAVLVGLVATVADLRAGLVLPVLLAACVFFLARGFAPPATRRE